MLEQIIQGLKAKGLDENAIKAEIAKLKDECDKFLQPQENQTPAESPEQKQERVFGI